MVMYGLIGERLLKRFLGGILNRTENDAVDKTGLPENGGKTPDQPDGSTPEKAQRKPKDEPVEEIGTKFRRLIQRIGIRQSTAKNGAVR